MTSTECFKRCHPDALLVTIVVGKLSQRQTLVLAAIRHTEMTGKLAALRVMVSYPDSRRSEPKLPYMCLGCSNRMYVQQ
jgi:hypothetical protein